MKPWKLIRWKLLIPLVVLAVVAYLFGFKPVARAALNRLRSGSEEFRMDVERIDANALGGTLDLQGIVLAFAREDKKEEEAQEKAFSASRIQFGAKTSQLLRKRFYGEMEIQAPRIKIQRQPDGRIALAGKEEEPPSVEEGAPPKKLEDWVSSALDWIERIKKIRERLPKGKEREPSEKPDEKERTKEPEKIDYKRRITYPYAEVSRFAISKIAGNDLEIEFLDESSEGQELPSLTDGKIEIANLSEKPSYFPKPIQWTVEAKISGAPIRFTGVVDLRQNQEVGNPVDKVQLEVAGQELPIELANLFAGDTFPVHFDKGKVNLDAKISLLAWDRIDIKPSLGLIDAAISPKEGVDEIAGFEARRFCEIFNKVGTLEVNDIRIGGTVDNPKVEMGNTLKEMVVSGGKAIIKEQADEALKKGMDELEEAIGDSLGEEESEALKGATEGLGEGLKEGLGRGLDGLFRKKEE